MKNENIFIGNICQIAKIRRIPGQVTGMLKNPFLEYLLTEREEIECIIIKRNALIRKVNDWTYQDIETRIKYREKSRKIGYIFIDENSLIPFNSLIEENLGKHLTRRKVLEKYKEIK